MKTAALFLTALLPAISFNGCAVTSQHPAPPAMKTKSSVPPHTVPHVDVARYMGDWRVIANIPYFGEKNCVDSVEAYALRPDGRIANTFTYRKKSFDAPRKQLHAVAKVENPQTNATWSVRFFGLISVDYLVLDLDPDYQWTVVGHPSRKYGWIMARQKTMPEKTYESILHRLALQGYDPGQFKRVPQIPSQIGWLH